MATYQVQFDDTPHARVELGAMMRVNGRSPQHAAIRALRKLPPLWKTGTLWATVCYSGDPHHPNGMPLIAHVLRLELQCNKPQQEESK